MQSLGGCFTILTTVESTNNYAMAQVHARLAKHGDAWLAMEQTKGKGQRSKNWQSNPGENIILSIVIEPNFLLPAQFFLLNAAIALGTLDFFEKYAGREVSIKWPNDIFFGDKKAGGILIENTIRAGSWLYAVAGIGLNINQNSFSIGLKAISLNLITGKQYDVVSLARELCAFLDVRFRQLEAGNKTVILKDYQGKMYKLNQMTKFCAKQIIFEGQVKGVSPEGLLIVETDQKKIQQWQWGELQWILP